MNMESRLQNMASILPNIASIFISIDAIFCSLDSIFISMDAIFSSIDAIFCSLDSIFMLQQLCEKLIKLRLFHVYSGDVIELQLMPGVEMILYHLSANINVVIRICRT